MATQTTATIDDLYRVKSKAELVRGEIVHMSPTAFSLAVLRARFLRELAPIRATTQIRVRPR